MILDKKLSSGLQIYVAKNNSPSVSVLSMVRAGSRDEQDDQIGGAHFLEHFVFKGTKKYPKVNDITKAIDGIGGKQNAFTWTDFTGYWVKVASDQIERGVEVIGQMVSEPLLPDEELEKEKGTIIEEIKMGEDHLPSKVWQNYESLLFPDSPLGRPIIGFEETIKNMKTENLKAFWERWYRPENMVVVISGGDFDTEKAVQLVEDNFAAISQKKHVNDRVGYAARFTQDSPRVNVFEKKSEQTHLVMGTRAYGANDSRIESLWVLSMLLGGNMSSRLWDEIREKRGLAYYIRAGFDAHVDQGSFYVRAGVRNKDVLEAVKVIKEELFRLVSEKVSADELQLAKAAVKGNLILDLEDSMEVAERLADSWATAGKVETLEETIAKIDDVDIDGLVGISRDLFETKNMNLALVGPQKDATSFEEVLKA